MQRCQLQSQPAFPSELPFDAPTFALDAGDKLAMRPLGRLALGTTAMGAYLLWSFRKAHKESLWFKPSGGSQRARRAI
jgi:hypothetical protein